MAASLIKLFHSVIFPLTVRAEDELSVLFELLVLFMSLLGHRYRGCPDTNPLRAPGLSKGNFLMQSICKALGKNPCN